MNVFNRRKNGSDDANAIWAIGSELSRIREGVDKTALEVAAIGTELKTVRKDQDKTDSRVSTLENQVGTISNSLARMEMHDTDIKNNKERIAALETWRSVKSSEWTAPMRLLLTVSLLTPITIAAIGLVSYFVLGIGP